MGFERHCAPLGHRFLLLLPKTLQGRALNSVISYVRYS
jgi:hypothetical protein